MKCDSNFKNNFNHDVLKRGQIKRGHCGFMVGFDSHLLVVCAKLPRSPSFSSVFLLISKTDLCMICITKLSVV